ncbi:hypothetical protein LTR36_008921 [Oleoguttula mirabilis]|uniref:Uncharacterized protein n=1 Tax=Oleoguttula mirabilis TaxID=1507867 RepID=A0AAV9J6S0_9PEZI|nr:hypothetical protein LTR36_008921 [Oleoguttula mirabilis]
MILLVAPTSVLHSPLKHYNAQIFNTPFSQEKDAAVERDAALDASVSLSPQKSLSDMQATAEGQRPVDYDTYYSNHNSNMRRLDTLSAEEVKWLPTISRKEMQLFLKEKLDVVHLGTEYDLRQQGYDDNEKEKMKWMKAGSWGYAAKSDTITNTNKKANITDKDWVSTPAGPVSLKMRLHWFLIDRGSEFDGLSCCTRDGKELEGALQNDILMQQYIRVVDRYTDWSKFKGGKGFYEPVVLLKGTVSAGTLLKFELHTVKKSELVKQAHLDAEPHDALRVALIHQSFAGNMKGFLAAHHINTPKQVDAGLQAIRQMNPPLRSYGCTHSADFDSPEYYHLCSQDDLVQEGGSYRERDYGGTRRGGRSVSYGSAQDRARSHRHHQEDRRSDSRSRSPWRAPAGNPNQPTVVFLHGGDLLLSAEVPVTDELAGGDGAEHPTYSASFGSAPRNPLLDTKSSGTQPNSSSESAEDPQKRRVRGGRGRKHRRASGLLDANLITVADDVPPGPEDEHNDPRGHAESMGQLVDEHRESLTDGAAGSCGGVSGPLAGVGTVTNAGLYDGLKAMGRGTDSKEEKKPGHAEPEL